MTPTPSPVTLSFAPQWYCVHTHPRKEAAVADFLRSRLGLEVYFPRLEQQRTIRRVRCTVTGPLFPRYCFCRFDLAHAYRAVRHAVDVAAVVSFGGRPALVPDELIADLKGWAGEAVNLIRLRPALRAGDRVAIVRGAMRGLEAVVGGELNDQERIAVILALLEREVHVTIDRNQLERIA